MINLLRKNSRSKSHYITCLSSQSMITRVSKKNFGCFCGVDKNVLPQADLAGALRNVGKDVRGGIDRHYASLTPQGVQHGVFRRLQLKVNAGSVVYFGEPSYTQTTAR